MASSLRTAVIPFTVLLGCLSAGLASSEQPAPTNRYWCPGKPGNELRTKPEPGCEPLIDETATPASGQEEPAAGSSPVRGNLEAVSDLFLQRYRHFLQCCVTAPTAGEEIASLDREASAILQESVKAPPLFQAAARIQALVVPVGRARDHLRAIRTQLDTIEKSKKDLDGMTYEQAGRQRRRIYEAEQELTRLATPPRTQPVAPTGTAIGHSTTNETSKTGGAIGASSFNDHTTTGTDIGSAPTKALSTTGSDIGKSSLNDISATDTAIGNSDFNEGSAVGSAIGRSSSPSGAATGSAIGNSSFNEQR